MQSNLSEWVISGSNAVLHEIDFIINSLLLDMDELEFNPIKNNIDPA